MQITTGGTYRLGQLRDVEVVEAASAAVVVSVGTEVALDETVYADTDGVVRISRLGDLIRPYMSVGQASQVTVAAAGVSVEITAEWNLLSDDGTPSKSYAQKNGGMLAETFKAVLADGTITEVPVYGITTELPEIERGEVVVNGVRVVVYSEYQIAHKIETGRLTGAGVRVLTGLAAAQEVRLQTGELVNIDLETEIYRTENNPLEERTATLTWRYAFKAVSGKEYDRVPAACEAKQTTVAGRKVLYTFVYDWNGSARRFDVYGTDTANREMSGVEIYDSSEASVGMADKGYAIEHTVNTGRMSRVELRALACLMASTSVTLNGVPVIVGVSDVEISSDPASERTASFTWRYADENMRLSRYE